MKIKLADLGYEADIIRGLSPAEAIKIIEDRIAPSHSEASEAAASSSVIANHNRDTLLLYALLASPSYVPAGATSASSVADASFPSTPTTTTVSPPTVSA